MRNTCVEICNIRRSNFAVFSKFCLHLLRKSKSSVTWLVTFERNTSWKVSVFGVFLVRIFSHSDWIWRDAAYRSTFSPNSEKYGPEIPQIRHFSRCGMVLNNIQKKLFRRLVGQLCPVTVGRYFKSCGWKQIIYSKVCSSIKVCSA